MEMFEQDYIMRLIHQIVMFVINLLFRRKEEEEAQYQDGQEHLLLTGEQAGEYEHLMELVHHGQVNEAENRLYDILDTGNMEDLKLALLFYDGINGLSPEELEQAGYTRQEIRDGISQVLGRYGYDGLAEAFEGNES